MKAKCPIIVPVAFIDSYKAFDTPRPPDPCRFCKNAECSGAFSKPMEYEEYKDMKSTEIATKAPTCDKVDKLSTNKNRLKKF